MVHQADEQLISRFPCSKRHTQVDLQVFLQQKKHKQISTKPSKQLAHTTCTATGTLAWSNAEAGRSSSFNQHTAQVWGELTGDRTGGRWNGSLLSITGHWERTGDRRNGSLLSITAVTFSTLAGWSGWDQYVPHRTAGPGYGLPELSSISSLRLIWTQSLNPNPSRASM